ncbi:DUF2252 family protein [Paenibacillus sp. WQ 127069]|uniref:DUF2252 family protein n=1 Tax=Paenibacillus baimaensis TaxID=2982185 RepID=A0ABT2UJ95_9BACL|nr:DUF2252 family protein [Paenibacillus sp. WQ 127069]MCU6794196.1 DUF2252 family protein [Paenibacillus sp. WQ 127069]
MVEKKTSRKVMGLLTALLIMNPIVGDFVSIDKAYAAEAGYVVISDIYSYGGNSASDKPSVFKNDYVELYNPTDQDVNFGADTWSLQYAGKNKTNWKKVDLGMTIPAHGYYLVKLGQEAANFGADLPTPDAVDTTINMDKDNGKVALVKNQSTITVNDPRSTLDSSVLVDLVFDYGSLSYKKSYKRKAYNPLNTLAGLKPSTNPGLGNGWDTDVDTVEADFEIVDPVNKDIPPRNSSSPKEPMIKGTANTGANMVMMDSLTTISAANATFTINVITGTVKAGPLTPVNDYIINNLPAGLTSSAVGDTAAKTITFTIAGAANANVSTDQALSVILKPTAVTAGAYSSSTSIDGVTLSHYTPKIKGTVSTGDADAAMRTATEVDPNNNTFTIALQVGNVKNGDLSVTDYTYASTLPSGLSIKAKGDSAANTVTFTVYNSATSPITESVNLSVVIKASAVTSGATADSDAINGITLLRPSAVLSKGEARKQFLLQEIKKRNAFIHDSATKEYKYAAMSKSAFSFYRATSGLFYKDLGGVIPVPANWSQLSNINTWISGDFHIQNVGYFDNNEGKAIFDLNDMDESYIAPFYWDLIRSTASIYLARFDDKSYITTTLDDSTTRQIAKNYLDAYIQTLNSVNGNNNEKSAELTSDKLSGFTKKLMEDFVKTTVKSQLDKAAPLTSTTPATRNFDYSKTDKYIQAKGVDLNDITDNWSAYVNSVQPFAAGQSSDYFKIKDVSLRINQGLGSLGVKRYNVLIEGPTASNDDDIILDVKEQGKPVFIDSPLFQSSTYDAFNGKDAERSKLAYQGMLTKPDYHLGTLQGADHNYLIRKISPYKGDYTDSKFTSQADFENNLSYAAQALANAHARSDNDYPAGHVPYSFEVSVVNNVYAGGKWDSFRTNLVNLGEDYYRQVVSDYNLVKADLAAGALVDIADLGNLTVTNGTLTPAFAVNTMNYTVSVPAGTSAVDVNAALLDSKASMTVNGDLYASNTDKRIDLTNDTTSIAVKVTARDMTTTKTYNITVNRGIVPVEPVLSSNANLNGLIVYDIVLTPEFAAGTASYTGYAGKMRQAVITAAAADAKAAILINGIAATSGTPSTVALNVGANEIKVQVTAQDGTIQVYTVTLTRINDNNNSNSSSGTGGTGTGTGSGAGSTGSETPSGSAGPTVSGEVHLGEGAVKESKETTADGKITTRLTVDSLKLTQALESLKKEEAGKPQVVIEFKGNDPIAMVELPVAVLMEALKSVPNAVITVKSELASYSLPIQTIDFTAAALQLGVDAKDIKVTIITEKVTGAALTQIVNTATRDGMTVVGAPMDFKVILEANGKQLDASLSNHYVARTISTGQTIDAAHTTAVRVEADGSFSFIPSRFIDNQAIILSPSNSIYAIVQTSNKFTDIDGHWAKADIQLLGSKLIVDGVSAQSFAPDTNITRAQFAALLIRSLGLSENREANRFTDVPSNNWSAGAVGAASKAGLIDGFEDGSFRPADPVTRQQMVVMIARAMKASGQTALTEVKTDTALASFKDQASIQAWAQPAAAQAVTAGIIQGMTADAFVPDSQATRAQATTMLKRLLQKLQFID